ncbi:putative phospholipase B-like 2 [Dermacentor albipictus]|uniref:putative phospholipase B-like 2 n=1 Tax=Dermacentor albipictus TaxID=60249 RepID=UPI0038FC73BF
MMMLLIALLILLDAFSSTAADFHGWMRKVCEDPPVFEIVGGEQQGTSPVWGSFVEKYSSQGYGFLELYTNESYSDRDQAFSAGIFEGYATADRALMHYDNLWKQYCAHQADDCVKLLQFVDATLSFMQQQVKELAEKDPYWHQVDMVLTQLHAISAGINAKKKKKRFFSAQDLKNVDASVVLFLNLDGELDDIEAHLRPVATSDVHDDEPMAGRRADSALVKLLPGNKDLLLSHVSGGPYAGMTKVLKKYSLNLHTTAKSNEKISGNVHATSSTPGKLASGDDFYILSNGLALMSTGIEVHNNSLYRFITPNCVFEFVRAIVANRLATSAKDWMDIYSKNPSGTNSKQWMIIDYNKFKSGQQLPDGLLWIVESLPGFIHTEDVTAVLRKESYWPSYNIPYSPFMFQLSGAPFNVQKYGDWFTYDKHPRAQIFKRDHVKVADTVSMVTLMRYNDFKHDPVAKCLCIPPFSAVNGISARSDLNMMHGRFPFPALGQASRGGVDMKMTNESLAARLGLIAVAGPTHDQQPPFRWSTSGFHDLHAGQPDLWNFAPFVCTWGKGNCQP